jgi:hypothetical protein
MYKNGAATKRWILQHLHHETVLAQKDGFQNKCIKKAHVFQLLHHKAEKLQNDIIIIYLQIKTNSLQMNTSYRTIYLESIFERKKIIYYKQSRVTAVFLIISRVHYKCTYSLHEGSL